MRGVRYVSTLTTGALALSIAVLLVASLAWITLPGLVTATFGVPDLIAAAERPPARPTVVVAADGSRLAAFRPEELHEPISAESIPPNVRAAVLAAEDSDFDEHRGVDVAAIVRAAKANIQSGGIEQGGSTITQQLVKNLFTSGAGTFDRKVREATMSVAIEAHYEKDEILAAYLNTTYFGEGAIGIGAAARTYFRKAAEDLTLSEAAMLAGTIPAPSDFNPRVAQEVAEERRLLVLRRLEATGLAPPSAIEAARGELPVVHPPRSSLGPHPYFVDYVRRWLLENDRLTPRQLFSGGLRIETTLDPGLQAAAHAAVARLPAGGPEAAVVVLDNRTGFVRAMLGGRDWASSQVNLALGRRGGGSGRQAGSAFKPFVLAALLEAGGSPNDTVPAPREHQPADGDKPVRNYTDREYGTVTIAEATHRSINTAYVIAAERAGPDSVAAIARRGGVNIPEDVGSSVALGAYEVSPLGMTRGFAAFARDGAALGASPVDRVLGPDGKVLLKPRPKASPPRVVSVDTARLVTHTLTGVVDAGTGRAAALDRPVAGKTGTTDDYTNAWFVGYTPTTTAAVWVGHRDGNVAMYDIAGVRAVTGGTLPAAIWRDVMAFATAGFAPTPFPPAPVLAPPTTTTTGPPPEETTSTSSAPAPPTTAPPVPTTAPPPPTTAAPRPTTTSTTSPPPTTPTTTKPKPKPKPPTSTTTTSTSTTSTSTTSTTTTSTTTTSTTTTSAPPPTTPTDD